MVKVAFLSSLLEGCSCGVVAIDVYGKIVLFNKTAEEMLGLRSERVVGRSIGVIEPFSALKEVLERGKSRLNARVEVGFSTFMVGMSPVVEEGKVVGAVAVFQDVTEFCKMANEL